MLKLVSSVRRFRLRKTRRIVAVSIVVLLATSGVVTANAAMDDAELRATVIEDSTIVVIGERFPAKTDVKIEFRYASEIFEQTKKTNTVGTFDISVKMPSTFRGRVDITATAKRSGITGLLFGDVTVKSGDGSSNNTVTTESPINSGTSVASTTTGTSAAPTVRVASSGFLSASGKNLMLDGKIYKYAGINAYGLSGNETGSPYSRSDIDALFKALPPQTMIRTWAWNSTSLESLRPIIESAEVHNQLLILSLSEGAGYDGIGTKNSDWYTSGFKNDTLPWVQQVVTAFKDSPAVGMWEIMNEPGNKSDEVSNVAMETFMSTMAATIKSIDPNHLVETGAMDCKNGKGFGNCAKINADKNIDVMSSHDYADNYEGGVVPSNNYTAAKSQLSSIEKPWIIGEIGINGGDGGCKRSAAERSAKYKQVFDTYFADGVAGINVWNWTKTPSCSGEGYDFGSNDPLMEMLRTYRVA